MGDDLKQARANRPQGVARRSLAKLGATIAVSWRRLRTRQLTLEDRNIRMLYLDTACGGMVSAGVYTFLPVFLVRLGASSLLVSLLTSLPAILMAALVVPAGWFVERQQDLVRFTTRDRVLHRLFFFLVPLVPFLFRKHVAEALVVLWALKSIPEAFIELSWTAVMAEIAPVHRRPSVNGNRWALKSVASAVLVAAFGQLLGRMAFPVNYQVVFFISSLGAAASVYVSSRTRLPSRGLSSAEDSAAAAPQASTRPGTTGRQSLGRRLREYVGPFFQTPEFLRYLLATFVLRFGMHLPAALYSIYWVRYLDASDAQIGWQATAAHLALIVGYLAWGRIATRQGHSRVLAACTIGMGLYPLFTGLISAPLWLPLVALAYGFSLTGIRIAFLDTLLQVCPVDRRPSFVALDFLWSQLTLFLAPLIGSVLADWLGVRTVFFVASSIHLLAFFLVRLFRVGADEK